MTEKNRKYSIEELAIGIVYKNLRSAKGFSQEDAAANEISATHLSNFENGKTIVSAHHFLKLLQNINVNAFEFQNAYNQYLQERDLFLFNTELPDALVEKDLSKLRKIINKIENQVKTGSSKLNNIKLRLDYIRTKSALSFLDSSYSLSKSEIKFLEEYLYGLTEWGQYDVALLGQSAKFLDPLHLIELTDRMISPSQSSINIPYVKQAIIQTTLNIINIFIDYGFSKTAKKFINYLENSKIHDYYMFEKLTLVYNTARYDFKNGNVAALETMKQCQKVLEFCNCSKTANWVAAEISELRKEKRQ